MKEHSRVVGTSTGRTRRNLWSGLSVGEARDPAEFLPSESGNVLVGASRKRDEPMPYETFLEQVGGEADIADSDVERCARAVVAVVTGRVGVDELENAQAQLPSNYGRLLTVEPVPVGRPFVTLVAERAALPPDVEAETVVRAVIETLGERLTRGEAEDLSRYLEGEAGTWVIDQESPNAAAFSADEFVDRVVGYRPTATVYHLQRDIKE